MENKIFSSELETAEIWANAQIRKKYDLRY